VTIGKRVQIFPLVYIGPHVTIGDDSIIYPHAALMKGTEIGKRVIIHCGAVIGDDGFGYAKDGNLQVKIPQVGKVVLADDVEIGANTTIDRATVDVTSVGRGTKIDNLVQIGHNCRFGEDCIMVSQAGMAGSVTIGDRVIIAAQAGIKDHTEIGHDATIAGRAGVTKSVASGRIVSGYPARDHREELKIEAFIRKLPEFHERLKALEKLVQDRTP
jgi:UDP-3-O-[3-hydroxymyristoyl] glucosamine N-acyltransferase